MTNTHTNTPGLDTHWYSASFHLGCASYLRKMLCLNIYQRSHPLEPAKWPSRSIPRLEMKTLRSRKDILVLQTYPQHCICPPKNPPFGLRQGRNVLLLLDPIRRLHRNPAAGEDNRFRPDRIDRAAHHTLDVQGLDRINRWTRPAAHNVRAEEERIGSGRLIY